MANPSAVKIVRPVKLTPEQLRLERILMIVSTIVEFVKAKDLRKGVLKMSRIEDLGDRTQARALVAAWLLKEKLLAPARNWIILSDHLDEAGAPSLEHMLAVDPIPFLVRFARGLQNQNTGSNIFFSLLDLIEKSERLTTQEMAIALVKMARAAPVGSYWRMMALHARHEIVAKFKRAARLAAAA